MVENSPHCHQCLLGLELWEPAWPTLKHQQMVLQQLSWQWKYWRGAWKVAGMGKTPCSALVEVQTNPAGWEWWRMVWMWKDPHWGLVEGLGGYLGLRPRGKWHAGKVRMDMILWEVKLHGEQMRDFQMVWKLAHLWWRAQVEGQSWNWTSWTPWAGEGCPSPAVGQQSCASCPPTPPSPWNTCCMHFLM